MEGRCWDPSFDAKYGLFSGGESNIQTMIYEYRDLANYSVITAVYSAFVDFALSFLPSYLIWNLQMEIKEKIGVLIAMSMGVL